MPLGPPNSKHKYLLLKKHVFLLGEKITYLGVDLLIWAKSVCLFGGQILDQWSPLEDYFAGLADNFSDALRSAIGNTVFQDFDKYVVVS